MVGCRSRHEAAAAMRCPLARAWAARWRGGAPLAAPVLCVACVLQCLCCINRSPTVNPTNTMPGNACCANQNQAEWWRMVRPQTGTASNQCWPPPSCLALVSRVPLVWRYSKARGWARSEGGLGWASRFRKWGLVRLLGIKISAGGRDGLWMVLVGARHMGTRLRADKAKQAFGLHGRKHRMALPVQTQLSGIEVVRSAHEKEWLKEDWALMRVVGVRLGVIPFRAATHRQVWGAGRARGAGSVEVTHMGRRRMRGGRVGRPCDGLPALQAQRRPALRPWRAAAGQGCRGAGPGRSLGGRLVSICQETHAEICACVHAPNGRHSTGPRQGNHVHTCVVALGTIVV